MLNMDINKIPLKASKIKTLNNYWGDGGQNEVLECLLYSEKGARMDTERRDMIREGKGITEKVINQYNNYEKVMS
jgi:hypothetical protein